MKSIRHCMIVMTLAFAGVSVSPHVAFALALGPTPPGAQAAVTTSAGDNNGFQTNPTNANASDDAYAIDLNTGTGNVTDGCATFNQSEDDAHTFSNFGLSVIPSDARIEGFLVDVEGNFDLDTGVNQLCIEFSWNGGTSWTSSGNTTGDIQSGSDGAYAVGGSEDTWGRSWSVSELSDANFRMRVMVDVSANNARDMNLDYLTLTTHYSIPLDLEGTLYSDEGVTPVTGGGKTIRLWVATNTPGVISTTTLSGTGVFRFYDVYGFDSGMLYALWVDNDSGFRSIRYGMASSGQYSIEGADLYQSHVIVASDQEGGNMGDSTFSSLSSVDDGDIPVIYSSETHIPKGMKLMIGGGTQFNVASQMTLHGNAQSGIDGDLHLASGIPFSHTWATSYDTPDSYVHSMMYIPGYTQLYAGVGDSTGVIYRCVVASTDCNEASDWTTAFDTTESSIHAMIYDVASSTLYFGTGNTAGIIYRCDLLTDCDTSGEFTTAYDTPEGRVTSFAIDRTGGVLYVGTGTGGIIYRCVLSTGCDTSGEFSTAYDTTETTIYSMWVDSVRDVLYVGTGSDGIIYRCPLSSNCDTSGDFSVAYNTPETVVYQFLTDEVTESLYVATGNTNGIIYRCLLSTGCDASGDFTTSYDSTQGYFESLVKDTHRNILYAGSGGGGQIHECHLSSLCDDSGDWSVYEDSAAQEIKDIVYASDSKDLYVGTGSINGYLYRGDRRGSETVLSLNADIAIAGNYVASSSNTVYSSASKGIYFTATTTGKTISGELVGNSTLGSTTFRGSGGSWAIQGHASATNITILQGALSIPAHTLSMTGDIINSGTYSAEGGATMLSGRGATYRGAVQGNHLGSLHVSSELFGQFQTVYNDVEPSITSFALDTVNRVLYAGSATGTQYKVLRCDMNLGCHHGANWVAMQIVEPGYVQTMIYEPTEEVVYLAGFSKVYRCPVSTLCDAPSDWTSVFTHGQPFATDMTLDNINQVLYVSTSGSASNGIIYRCAISTSCDASGDFTISLTSEEDDNVDKLAIDHPSGMLFAITSGTTGALRRCMLSSGCDASTDWSTSTVSSQLTDIAVNQEDGHVYLVNSSVMLCKVRSGCDGAEDFLGIGSLDSYGSQRIAYSSSTETLYVVQSINSIFACHMSTYCDESSDFEYLQNTPEVISDIFPLEDAVLTGSQSGDIQIRGLMNMMSIESPISLATSTDTTETTMYALSIDTQNGVLYAGSGTNGIIYRCALSTSCDSMSDWTTSYDSPSATIYVIEYDPTNGVLYAGTGNAGVIYRCATSTGCNESSDWTTSYDTPEVTVYDIKLDVLGGVLYAGTGNLGVLYRCETSTGCDASGDWTIAYDTTALYLLSFTIDTVNRILYVGSGSGGIVYRCALSTLCNESTDFTTAYDTTENNIFSMAFDQAIGAIYLGSNPSGIIYKCYTESGCDASTDFITAYDTTETSIYSLLVDRMNGYLHAGGVSSSVVFRCALSTLCDTSADYSTVLDLPESGVLSMKQERETGAIFMGSGSAGTVYRYGPLMHASTTALTIDSGTTLRAPAHLSVSGDYTNLGTFDHQYGTVYVHGVSPQIATGTMVGSSAFNNLTILNNSGTNADTNPGVIFGAVSSTTGLFTATLASTTLRFPAGATTSMNDVTMAGSSANAPIYLRSSLSGTPFKIAVSGTTSISYANVKDSHACAGYGNIVTTSSVDAGNTTCWSFGGGDAQLTLLHYRFRDDNGSESGASALGSEDSVLTDYAYLGDRTRLRMLISNTGAAATTSITYRLEYSSSTCTVWERVPETSGAQHFATDLSQYVLGGSPTTNSASVSDPAGVFVAGEIHTNQSQASAHGLSTSQFTELEFTFRSTALATPGTTYCFRLTNAGSTYGFIYTVRPELVISAKHRPQFGGGSVDAGNPGAQISGGGQHGGGDAEGGGGGSGHSGGGSGGGGGAE